MAARTDRALEQVILRQVRRRAFNERLRHTGSESPLFRCECGLIGCGAVITLTAEDYATLRESPRRFAVLAGHVLEEAERVVATHGAWVAVEKPIDPPTLPTGLATVVHRAAS